MRSWLVAGLSLLLCLCGCDNRPTRNRPARRQPPTQQKAFYDTTVEELYDNYLDTIRTTTTFEPKVLGAIAMQKHLYLRKVNLSGKKVAGEVNLTDAGLSDTANFSMSAFKAGFEARRTRFGIGDHPCDFAYDTFYRDCIFGGAAFYGDVDFRQCYFYYPGTILSFFARANATAEFNYIYFAKRVTFTEAEFNRPANFGDDDFRGSANFYETEFDSWANFHDDNYHGVTDFTNAIFRGASIFLSDSFATCKFNGAKFHSIADFNVSEFKGVLNFELAEYASRDTFSNSVSKSTIFFDNVQFRSAKFYDSVKFYNIILLGNMDFSNAWFGNYAGFRNIDFRSTGRLDFTNAVLPDTLDFSANTIIPQTIDLTAANFTDPALFDSAARTPYKKHQLYLFKSDISKLQLDYTHFQLIIDSSLDKPRSKISDDDAEGMYEALLNNFKSRGQNESYKLLDIEYQQFKWRHSWASWLIWLPEWWWNFGYNKEYVFYWTASFLLIFTAITFFFIDYLNAKVYGMKNIPVVGRGNLFNRLWYAFVYSANIFFRLTLKVEDLHYNKFWATLYVMFMYTLGLVCLAYMANFVLQK